MENTEQVAHLVASFDAFVVFLNVAGAGALKLGHGREKLVLGINRSLWIAVDVVGAANDVVARAIGLAEIRRGGRGFSGGGREVFRSCGGESSGGSGETEGATTGRVGVVEQDF